MSSVRIEQKSYEMPPRDGFTITHYITVADIDRSADFYEEVFGGRILSRGDSKGASGHIQIANTEPRRSVLLRVPDLQYDLAGLVWCARKHALRLARLRKRED